MVCIFHRWIISTFKLTTIHWTVAHLMCVQPNLSDLCDCLNIPLLCVHATKIKHIMLGKFRVGLYSRREIRMSIDVQVDFMVYLTNNLNMETIHLWIHKPHFINGASDFIAIHTNTFIICWKQISWFILVYRRTFSLNLIIDC